MLALSRPPLTPFRRAAQATVLRDNDRMRTARRVAAGFREESASPLCGFPRRTALGDRLRARTATTWRGAARSAVTSRAFEREPCDTWSDMALERW